MWRIGLAALLLAFFVGLPVALAYAADTAVGFALLLVLTVAAWAVIQARDWN